MTISGVEGKSRWANAVHTAYVFQGMEIEVRKPASKGKSAHIRQARVGAIPAKQQTLRLKLGDTLVLTRSLDPGRPPQRDGKDKLSAPAQIGVSLPEFFDGVKAGEPIWLDDGMIGGVIRKVAPTKSASRSRKRGLKVKSLAPRRGSTCPRATCSYPLLPTRT